MTLNEYFDYVASKSGETARVVTSGNYKKITSINEGEITTNNSAIGLTISGEDFHHLIMTNDVINARSIGKGVGGIESKDIINNMEIGEIDIEEDEKDHVALLLDDELLVTIIIGTKG